MKRPITSSLALAHLRVRIEPVLRALRVATAAREQTAQRLRELGASPHAITRAHADTLIDSFGEFDRIDVTLTGDEIANEHELREQAALLGVRLPFDELVDHLGLDAFECEVLALCCAAELDRELELAIAYIHDETTRGAISVELAARLTAETFDETLERRTALGRFGRLQRFGLITTIAGTSTSRDTIRIHPLCLEALLGTPIDIPLVFRDPAAVTLTPPTVIPADAHLVGSASSALAAGKLDIIAIWGRQRMTRDVVAAIAQHVQKPLRRYPGGTEDATAAATAARALDAVLWIDFDAMTAVPAELVEVCRTTRVPLVLTGAHAWRPTDLLATRNTLEIPVREIDSATRGELWRARLPEIVERADQLAAAYRFDDGEVTAATRLARTSAALRSNGTTISVESAIADACVAVARKQGERNTTLVTPRRGPDDLVLAPELHARVLELALDFRALPHVMERWGFATRVSGSGIKAMFTGDSGTGKTLAAEIVAGQIGLPMLKVDLARIVSKWVGETEKNLDTVFTEARDSHAVLFFDEAEALFGARADVRHGTDRYANLEVSYLLQRLEDHAGVVILATNLPDKIDRSFIRRFHAVLNFPPPERARAPAYVATRVHACDSRVPTTSMSRYSHVSISPVPGSSELHRARRCSRHAMTSPWRWSTSSADSCANTNARSRVLLAHELGAFAVHIPRA